MHAKLLQLYRQRAMIVKGQGLVGGWCSEHTLTLFDIGGGGGMMASPHKMVLTTVLKRVGGGTWNLVTFKINLWSIKKSYFWFPRLSGVTIAMSLSGSTRDFMKLSFHIFPYSEILKVFKSKIWLDIWNKHPKIPLNMKFQPIRWRDLELRASEM